MKVWKYEKQNLRISLLDKYLLPVSVYTENFFKYPMNIVIYNIADNQMYNYILNTGRLMRFCHNWDRIVLTTMFSAYINVQYTFGKIITAKLHIRIANFPNSNCKLNI